MGSAVLLLRGPSRTAPGVATVPATVATLAAAAALLGLRGLTVLGNGIVTHDHTAARTHLTGLAERLQQAEAELLAGHLDQTERGDLGNLVFGTVATEALDQTAKHEVAVRLEHHVDEVDHDDSADVAQPKLAHDLLCRLKIVLSDGLLEVAA